MSTVLETGAPQPETRGDRPPFAIGGVAAVAVVSAIALFASIGRYGFFGDELYFISAGRRLAASYADQGPLAPAIARLMDLMAPGSLVAQRIPAVLITLAAIVISAQIAREFGGSRRAQVLTAIAYATSPFLLAQGAQLSTNAVDTALWVVIGWLVIRWVRTRQDMLLLWAGVVTAIDMQVKWLVPFFWAAIAVGVLVFGPRELLRRPMLWWGAALVALTMLPSLFWQARHGWPQLGMGAQVAAEQSAIGGRVTFVPMALILAGALGLLLLACGMWALLRWEPLRPYRFLGLVLPLLMLAFLVTNGRAYYVIGCYPAIIGAGAVWWAHRAVRWRRIVAASVVVVSVITVAWALPWKPESQIPSTDDETAIGMDLGTYGKFGWTELREAVAAAYRALPEPERARAVIVTDNYWQAGALDVARDDYGLPAVYSPNRGFGYFGTPPDSATTVLWVGGEESDMRSRFTTVTAVGRVNARLGIPGIVRDVTLWRCDGPIRPWSQAWSDMLGLG
ncbi:ArnT family glycosyltransferase [Nocardia transvalensis]|uniref:ArnT family glycosyltransferase n=1 Tax=Nocardia transvalensis TaxID=37333 RepID=UPI001894BA27|nr:glycosyltransferase family 39 protein [Nocardia transvalensis]MBF6331343.1 glycosyltransferase family 39 protein [Nocardia transvalensis]